MTTATVIASSLVLVGGTVTAAPAAAAEPLLCTAGQTYVQKSDGTTRLFDVNNNTEGAIVASGLKNNALAISAGGRYIFTAQNSTSNQTDRIAVYDTQTETTQLFDTPSGTPNALLRGAVNPVTGLYYFAGGANSDGSNIWLGALNPVTGESFKVGGISGTSGANGDMAFTASGQLLLVADRNVYSVNETLTTVAGSETFTTTGIVTLASGTEGNGIAFGGGGYLYVSIGSQVLKVDPANPSTAAQAFNTTSGNTDMASCAFPNTLTLQKNVDGARVLDGDQFTLNMTGGSFGATVKTTTTTGNLTGIQANRVGPEFVNQGTAYTLSEAAAGTTVLSAYDTSMQCVEYTADGAVEVEGNPNQWTVTGPTNPQGTDVVCTITNKAKPADPSIKLTKTADEPTYAAVGDVVTYEFLVENDGDVPLTAVDVNDELAGLSDVTFAVWPGAPNQLLPTQSVTGTATLTITQAHIDAGKIDNTATATGMPPTPPGGETPVPVTDTDDETVTGPVLNPALSLVKSADVDTFELGDTITYTFTATNTGNATLTGVTIADPLAGLSDLEYDWSKATATGVLAPGEQVTATATYVATQADVDNGFVYNAATASGTPPTPPGGETPPPVETPPADVVVDGPTIDPSITLVKTGVLSDDGESITYTFVSTNTGNVTLTGVTLTDPLTGLSPIVLDWSDATADGTLAPGEFVTGTATYAVSQADINAGSVVNEADTAGTPPNLKDPEDPEGPGTPQEPVTDDDPETVPLSQFPAISLVKTGALVEDGVSQVGDLVEYTFIATNTGNVQLSDVEITDPLPELSALTYDWSNATADGVLAPGEWVTATATYELTQADIDAGEVLNTATASGTPPTPTGGETPDPVTDEDDETVNPVVDPDLSLVKSADVDTFVLGDTITYTFTATNTGNATLTGVTIADPLAGLSDLVYDWSEATGEGVLAPGESVTATATYVATQADVDNGFVYNAATASGTPPTPPGGETPPPVETPPAEVVVDGPTIDPSITLVKTGVLDIAAAAKPGDLVEYTFVATNDGNVTLTGVGITDPLDGLSAISFDWSDATAVGTLAPGEFVTGTATYALTQADINAGHVDNTATTVGTPPNLKDPEDPEGPGTPQEPVGDEDDETVIVPVDPSISLVKTGALAGVAAAGTTVNYTFVATNTGNVELTDVEITDPLTGLSALTYDWSDAVAEGVLAPGDTVTATATYVVTQADVDAGSVMNLATSTGTPPNAYDPEDPEGPGIPQEPVSDEDPATVELPQNPAIQIVKTGALVNADSAAGHKVNYTFVATNIGNVTLTDVEITDPLAGLSAVTYDWSAATGEGVLAPGDHVTGTAEYTLTQADVNAGHVDNTATASGLPPVDPENPDEPVVPVTDEDDETVIVPSDPAIELVKSSELLGDAVAGDEVEYTFVATNTGNVTLTGVTIVDPLPGLGALSYVWPGAAGVLNPGDQVTATATYVLTQQDVDRGAVLNTATSNGTPPNAYDPENPDGPGIPQEPVSDDDTVVTPLPADPAIELVKSSELLGDAVAGDEVEYTFVATNTGNVTLTGVTIVDPLPGLSALVFDWTGATAEGVLAPGESVTATALYTLTQTDVDNGTVENTATSTGTPPNAFDPENPDGPGIPQEPVSDDDTVVTPLPADPAIALVKTAAVAGKGLVGDKVNYTFVATNTGNVTLSGVVIADPLKGLSSITYTWPGAAGVLAPGESVKATASYVLTEVDVKAGKVVNSATVTGFAPNGEDPVGGEKVTDDDSVTVRTGQLPVTGGEASGIGIGVAGFGMLLLGAGLVLVARKRKQTV